MTELAGCRIADRAPVGGPAVLRFVARWGPFEPGDELELPAAGPWDLHLRGVRLRLEGAETVAVDDHGEPALVSHRTGRGYAVTCAYPLELLLASRPDAHGPRDRTWGVYRGLADLAGIRPAVAHPDIVTGALRGPGGGLLTLTNHSTAMHRFDIGLPDGARNPRIIGPAGDTPLDPAGPGLELPPTGGVVVAYDR